MNRNFPSPFLGHSLRVSNPANLAGLDTRKGVCTPMVPGSCVKPTYLAGFTQLAGAGQGVTMRVFTQ